MVERELQIPTSEADLASLIRGYPGQVIKLGCPGVLPTINAVVQANTTQRYPVAPLASGEELVVKVERLDPGGKVVATWDIVFGTGPRGSWLLSYGFTFLPNRDELFFTKATGDDTFTVTPQSQPDNDLVFVPSIFYTWLPRAREGRDLAIGPTAGIGFDRSDPAIFLGASILYNQNISFVVGVAAHRQRRLAGQYRDGDELKEVLAEDSLHQSSFFPNYFLGVTFRFGASPFTEDE